MSKLRFCSLREIDTAALRSFQLERQHGLSYHAFPPVMDWFHPFGKESISPKPFIQEGCCMLSGIHLSCRGRDRLSASILRARDSGGVPIGSMLFFSHSAGLIDLMYTTIFERRLAGGRSPAPHPLKRPPAPAPQSASSSLPAPARRFSSIKWLWSIHSPGKPSRSPCSNAHTPLL